MRLLPVYLICCTICLTVFSVEAQNASLEKTLSPYFFIKKGDPSVDRMPLKETKVDVNITGVIADVTVTQKYANEGIKPINAKYIFPGSTRAAVHGMKMIIGDDMIVAKIKEKKQAKAEFVKAKKAGKSASLLEQKRPNVFSMNVANIIPGDEVEIELKYTELLVPTDGVYEFVYPTVVGPRYSSVPESEATEANKWIKNPYLGMDTEDRTYFDIKTTLSGGMPIQSLRCYSHHTHITYDGETVANVALDHGMEAHSNNRDYILAYRLSGDKIASGLMLYEGKDENFFLLMAQPPKRVHTEDIPEREYVFIVDVSGSMNGFPLSITKKLLRDLIENLRPTDKFNVILFAGTSNIMAPRSVAATQENIQRAIYLIDRQSGGGGTELYSAVQRALSLPHEKNASRSFVLVTDGFIGAEQRVFELITKNLNKANVFAFGIGTSVNRHLIEGVAKAGQGEPFVITSPDNAHRQAKKFRDYIKSPVLTNISVSYKGFKAYDIEPEIFPDLLAQRPIVVFGKWRGKRTGSIAISGVTGSGEYNKTFKVAGTLPKESHSPLRYLWARKRIAKLSDFNFRSQTAEEKAEVISLGLTYNLLTQHTSFIAVLEKIRNEGDAADVKQPLPLPKGVSELAVGGKVPEPELYILVFLLGSFVICAWFFRKRKQASARA